MYSQRVNVFGFKNFPLFFSTIVPIFRPLFVHALKPKVNIQTQMTNVLITIV